MEDFTTILSLLVDEHGISLYANLLKFHSVVFYNLQNTNVEHILLDIGISLFGCYYKWYLKFLKFQIVCY